MRRSRYDYLEELTKSRIKPQSIQTTSIKARAWNSQTIDMSHYHLTLTLEFNALASTTRMLKLTKIRSHMFDYYQCLGNNLQKAGKVSNSWHQNDLFSLLLLTICNSISHFLYSSICMCTIMLWIASF